MLQCFLHLFLTLPFFSHFLIVIFLLHLMLLRRLQKFSSGGDRGDGGAEGGESGSGSHKPHKWGTLGHPGENDVRKIVPRQPRAILRIRYSSYVK